MANKSYKGRRFEIWLATELSKWWTNGERDDVYYHTHDSGGRATKRTAKGKSTKGLHGDIHAVDPIGQPLLDLFVLECKNGYPRATLHDLLDKPNKAAKQTWEKWIEKAEASAKAAGVDWWLIFHRRDRRETVVVMPFDAAEYLSSEMTDRPPSALIETDSGGIVGTTLGWFLNEADPIEIEACSKSRRK